MADTTTDPYSFSVLPQENQAAFDASLAELIAEHKPVTPTERFLVLEMARAQWKIARAAIIEAGAFYSEKKEFLGKLYLRFVNTYEAGSASPNMVRYEATARRAFYLAFRQLQALRRSRLSATLPAAAPKPVEMPVCQAKPIPARYQRELDSHRRRDPLFDPQMDRSQLSRELQRYLDRNRVSPEITPTPAA